jgi:hypothetical protein
MRETIERRLAELRDEEAGLDRQVRGAMRLARSDDAGLAAEAERVLGEISTDRLALTRLAKGLHAQLRGFPSNGHAQQRSRSSSGSCSTPRGSLMGGGSATTGTGS